MINWLTTKSINIILIIFIALGLLLRIIFIDQREFWFDEVLSLLLVTGKKQLYQTPQDFPISLSHYLPLLNLTPEKTGRESLKTIIQLLRGIVAEPHPPLFFLTQHFWLRLFGNSEPAMRSLQVLLSIGAMGSGYGLGRITLGNRGGLILAALIAVNPFFLFHSLNVRMYCGLILWVTVGSWALIELIKWPKDRIKNHYFIIWNLIFITSITAGMLTFYTIIYWLMGAGLLILWLDRSRWWQHGLRFAIAFLLFIPWAKWGLTQQLRNADFGRFNVSQSLVATLLRHLQELTQTIGIHLLVGDTVTRLSLSLRLSSGILAMIVLIIAIIMLWKQGEKQRLKIGFCLGIVPLLLAFSMDILTGKFTVGFGWGRSVSYALPGCLLLLTIWLDRTLIKWRNLAILGILTLYLSISIADFTLRPRQVFHQLNTLIDPNIPTLIAMNSKADGHLLRLVYYSPPTARLDLFAQNTVFLPSQLENFLTKHPNSYPRLIWLDIARPVWGAAKTREEQINYQKEMEALLNQQFTLKTSQFVSGTWTLDDFMIRVYHSNNSLKKTY